MRVLCCGCRRLADPAAFARALAASPFAGRVTAVRHGAAGGADALARSWAEANGVPHEPFPAAWDDLTAPDAVVVVGRGGKPYDARAGPARNARMLATPPPPDGVLALWDGRSHGTRDLLARALAARRTTLPGLIVHVHWVRRPPPEALA